MTQEQKLRAEAFTIGYLQQAMRAALSELEGVRVAGVWRELAGGDWGESFDKGDPKQMREIVAKADWRIEEARRQLREALETAERRGREYAEENRFKELMGRAGEK